MKTFIIFYLTYCVVNMALVLPCTDGKILEAKELSILGKFIVYSNIVFIVLKGFIYLGDNTSKFKKYFIKEE